VDDATASDPVAAALAAARALARGRPVRRRPSRRDAGSAGTARRGGYSGPAPDAADPQPIGEVLAGYVGDRGWQRPLDQARVFADWAGLVGPEVAAHCHPASLRDGELTVRAQSTAWATQLRLLGGTLLARVVAEVGPDVVSKIVVTGPTGPSWKHGRFTVPGARGPRDTYG
jgi:predicted nucleic acid-binding Zn ribbon protein